MLIWQTIEVKETLLLFTYRIYRKIFPFVQRELSVWKEIANRIPDVELRRQALLSIDNKTFHCEGGAIYAVPALTYRDTLIPLIVAFQTISDYLDNLCDRSTSMDPQDFRQLHLAMLDALTPGAPLRDYYQFREEKEEGYLNQLVLTCQKMIDRLPGYHDVQDQVLQLAQWYTDLQVHKHVIPSEREIRLKKWWQPYSGQYSDIHWNEFAAATGSTLGIFILFQLATRSKISEQEVRQTMDSYFPWICGLHILLDYLVDLEEDRIGGDLNFISYYTDERETIERLTYIFRRAHDAALRLPNPNFHKRIVEGLIGLYLADGKVERQPMVSRISRALMKQSSWRARFFYMNSRLYRGKNQLEQKPREEKELL